MLRGCAIFLKIFIFFLYIFFKNKKFLEKKCHKRHKIPQTAHLRGFRCDTFVTFLGLVPFFFRLAWQESDPPKKFFEKKRHT